MSYIHYAQTFDKIFKKHTGNNLDFTKFEGNSDTTKDCSWNIGDLSPGLGRAAEDMGKMADLEDWAVIKSGKPYVTYDPDPPKACAPSWAYADCVKIVKETRNNHRRSCFAGSRLEATMKRAIIDFKAKNKCNGLVPNSYEFIGYNLKIRKGGESEEVLKKYRRMGVTDDIEIYARSSRDFYFSAVLFQHLRGFDIKDCSMPASCLCLASCLDYVDMNDDRNTGGDQAYVEAMLDGCSLYTGAAYAQSIDDCIMCTTVIYYKDDLVNSKEPIISAMTRIPKASEFLEFRWWDGAMPPYYRMVLLAAGKSLGFPVDRWYAALGSKVCPRIRKGLDTILRYNEIVDCNHDIHTGEPCNELHVAARYGGLKAALGYGSAVSATVDDVAQCDCEAGDRAHDYAVDIAMGGSGYNVALPRYRTVIQMAECAHETKAEYDRLLKESNHMGFITTEFAVIQDNIGLLHYEDWSPVWKMTKLVSKGPDCAHCKIIGDWIVYRCLYRDEMDSREEKIRNYIKSRVHNNPSTNMEEVWGDLYNIVVQGRGLFKELMLEGEEALKDVWRALKPAADQTKKPEDLIDQVVDLQTALDSILIRSNISPYGHVIRRAVIGLASVIFDRTYVTPFERIINAAIIDGDRRRSARK